MATTARPVKPEKTMAMVVGVDKTLVDPTNELRSPCEDACGFVEWLASRGVHRNRIRLFLEPSSASAARLAAKPNLHPFASPTRAAIEDAIVTHVMAEGDGELFILFWAGHGALHSGRNRVLFFSDAKEGQRYNLHLDNLLLSLASVACKQYFRQIAFIDACANYAPLEDGSTLLPEFRFQTGAPNPLAEQFVIYSVRENERAPDPVVGAADSFTGALLEQLKGPSGSVLPPDMPSIHAALFDWAKTVRVGGTRYSPTFMSLDWDNLRTNYNVLLPMRRWAGRCVLPARVVDLATAITRSPTFRSAARRKLMLRPLSFWHQSTGVGSLGRAKAEMQQLRALWTPGDAIDPGLQILSLEIAGRCIEHAGGVETLAESMIECDRLEPSGEDAIAGLCETLQRLFPQRVWWSELMALKQALRDDAGTAHMLLLPVVARYGELLHWEECGDQSPHTFVIDALSRCVDSPMGILAFVRGLARVTTRNDLRPRLQKWAKAVGDRCGVREEQLVEFECGIRAPAAVSAKPRLLIKVEPSVLVVGAYVTRSWLITADGSDVGSAIELDRHDTPARAAELPTIVSDSIARAARRLEYDTRRLVLEMLLPLDLQLSGVEKWQIPAGSDQTRHLGRHHQLVRRSLERWYNADMRPAWPLWLERWEKRPLLGSEAEERHIRWVEECNCGDQLYDLLTTAGPLCLCPVLAGNPALTLRSVLNSGTPVALWVHGLARATDNASIKETLLRLATRDAFENLPDRVKQFRAKSATDPAAWGDHLALMWDDPKSQPPDVQYSFDLPEIA